MTGVSPIFRNFVLEHPMRNKNPMISA